MSKRIPEHALKELARAKKALFAAKTLIEKGLFEDCVSRAYYAVLHAAKAALFLVGVEFRVANARNLSLDDALFDMVICEFIIAFVENKQKIIKEFVRVTKPGGYIGLSEAVWIKSPPPTELVEYPSRVTGVKEILTYDGWKKLLDISQLRDIEVRTYKINKVRQFINEMRQLGFRDFLKGWCKFLSLCIKSSAFRNYLKKSWPSSKNVKNMFDYLGYGIYVGRR